MALRLVLGVALVVAALLAQALHVHLFFVTFLRTAGMLIFLTALLWPEATWRRNRWVVPVVALVAAGATVLFDLRPFSGPVRDLTSRELVVRVTGSAVAVAVFGYLTLRFVRLAVTKRD